MLILTRRKGETIRIGGDVKITVLAIKGSQARIGITAPRDISVHRQELYERIVHDEVGDGAPKAGLESDGNIDNDIDNDGNSNEG